MRCISLLLSLLLLLSACYTGPPRAGHVGDRRPVLVVHNNTGVTVGVYDRPNGLSMGRVTMGIDTVRLSFISINAKQVFFKLTADPTYYPSPPENLAAYKCWEVDINFINPGRDIWATFLPCRS